MQSGDSSPSSTVHSSGSSQDGVKSDVLSDDLPDGRSNKLGRVYELAIDSLSQLETKVVVLLAECSGLATKEVKQAMKSGAVWVSRGRKNHRRIRRFDARLKIGDRLTLYYNPQVLSSIVDESKLLEDFGDFSVWYKPSGVFSQGSLWGDHCTIQRQVELYFQPSRPAFLVHRLDRAASGLVLLAHGKSMAAKLSGLFENRKVDKFYHAVVLGDAREFAEPKRIELDVDGKAASSIIRCLNVKKIDSAAGLDSGVDGYISLVEVQILTGRKHQIRKHLAALGFPILGDRMYGVSSDAESFGGVFEGAIVDLQLRAFSLSFISPITQSEITIELPESMQLSLDSFE